MIALVLNDQIHVRQRKIIKIVLLIFVKDKKESH